MYTSILMGLPCVIQILSVNIALKKIKKERKFPLSRCISSCGTSCWALAPMGHVWGTAESDMSAPRLLRWMAPCHSDRNRAWSSSASLSSSPSLSLQKQHPSQKGPYHGSQWPSTCIIDSRVHPHEVEDYSNRWKVMNYDCSARLSSRIRGTMRIICRVLP